MTDRPDERADPELEARVRDVLGREAGRVQPADRLDAIRAATATPTGRPAWWAPVAAAAAVAVVAGGAWVLLRPGGTPTLTPALPTSAATRSASAAPTTAPGPVTSTPPTASSTTTAPTSATSGSTVMVALPVYRVAAPQQPDGRYGLVREFVPGSLPASPTAAQKADAALALALTVPTANPNGYVAAWPAGTTARYVALRAPEVGVALSGPGVRGLPEEAQRLAVQALVWTVTAAVQQASAPVPVTVSTGGDIFETVGTNVFKRPADDQAYTELAPVWVDSPYAGQRLPADQPVTISGQACAFEANVVWLLFRDGVEVRGGTTPASSGCPVRGSWGADLGVLPPGDYEIRAKDTSAKDGSVVFQSTTPFTVG